MLEHVGKFGICLQRAKTKCPTLDSVLSKSKRAKTTVSKMAIWAVALSGVLAVKFVQ